MKGILIGAGILGGALLLGAAAYGIAVFVEGVKYEFKYEDTYRQYADSYAPMHQRGY